MKVHEVHVKQSYLIKLEPTDDLIESLEKFAVEHNVTGGRFYGLGGLDTAVAGYVEIDGKGKPLGPPTKFVPKTVANAQTNKAPIGLAEGKHEAPENMSYYDNGLWGNFSVAEDKEGNYQPVIHAHMAVGSYEEELKLESGEHIHVGKPTMVIHVNRGTKAGPYTDIMADIFEEALVRGLNTATNVSEIMRVEPASKPTAEELGYKPVRTFANK